VSSSNDEGQQRLAAAAPGRILLSLRPYRQRGDQGTWMRDTTVPDYLEQRLARYRYVAIGEFHIFGADVDLPVPRRMIELAAGTSWCCTRIRTPMQSSGSSRNGRRRASCGRIPVSTRRRGCAKCCAGTRTCGATSPSAPTTLPVANSMLSGATCSSNFRPLHGRHRHLHARALAVRGRARKAGAPLACAVAAGVAERIAWRNGETLFAAAIR